MAAGKRCVRRSQRAEDLGAAVEACGGVAVSLAGEPTAWAEVSANSWARIRSTSVGVVRGCSSTVAWDAAADASGELLESASPDGAASGADAARTGDGVLSVAAVVAEDKTADVVLSVSVLVLSEFTETREKFSDISELADMSEAVPDTDVLASSAGEASVAEVSAGEVPSEAGELP